MENSVSILVVDDLPENHVAMEAILSKFHQNIIFAHSGTQALRLILQHEFAVILLDVNMPGLNGLETARIIRSREKNNYTPIIFLTCLDRDQIDINEGYSIGAVDFIFKPINPIILSSKVKVFIDLFTKSTLAFKLQEELENRKKAEIQSINQKRQLDIAELNRFTAIKELTSAISHELTQPLTSISNYITGSLHLLSNPDFLKKDSLISALEIAKNETYRAGEILHRIKNFSRKKHIFFENVVLNNLIMNIVSLLEDRIKSNNININFTLCDKLNMPVLLDKIQIEQVMINLLKNSKEALINSKTKDPTIKIETLLTKSNKIIIEIKDNGPGIDASVLNNIFDLYVTTKEKGIGIGLAICRAAIEAHRGNIIATNNLNGGAIFKITLPLKVKEEVENV